MTMRTTPRPRADMSNWSSAEALKRKHNIEAKRQATRQRKGVRRAPPVPANLKPRMFHIPINLRRDWFPDDQHYWHAAYFVHLIHFRKVTYRDEDGWTLLLYRLLQQIIPQPILKVIKEVLLRRKVIECDDTFEIGRKALGYRILPGFKDRQKVACGNDGLNARLWRSEFKAEERMRPVHRWLKSFYQRLEFDSGRARKIIASLPKPGGYEGTAAEYRAGRLDHWDALVAGEWWFKPCDYGRFHHPLTALEKELRCCLSVGGRPLVNVDLKNSQPLLLGIKAKEWLCMSKMSRSRERNRVFDEESDLYHATDQSITHRHKHKTRRSTRIINLNKSGTPLNSRGIREARSVTLPDDLTRYIECCERGEFYESMMTDEQRQQGEAGRDRLKKLFMIVLFGENRAKDRRFDNSTRRRFKRIWPSAAKVLADLKRRNYKHSSHLLQNYEATIMIHRVCRRIRRERPALPIYTIHDSIMVMPDAWPLAVDKSKRVIDPNVAYVQRVILDEFSRLEVTPTLKIEVPDDR